MDEYTKDLLDVIINGLQLAVIVYSVIWAYRRFRKENPLHPRIEFDIDCDFYGPQSNSFLAVFTITANNKGNVEHKFRSISLRVRGIKKDETLSRLKDGSPIVNFPEKIIEEINMIPTKDEYYFVRPGVHQAFNYTALLAETTRFILVKAIFNYDLTKEPHYAEKVFEVKR